MKKLFLLLIIFLLMPSCGHRSSEPVTTEEQAYADSVVNSSLSTDSIDFYLTQFIADGNTYGIMRAHIENANRKQAASDYNDALEDCKKALEIAEQLADTLQMMNILNNMGTNLRRLGAMGEASSYFYKVLNYYQTFSGNDEISAKKNRLVALNSIGNINKTIGNNEAADSLFRISLKGSLEIDDIVGCAVNSANIGLIFELKGQIDSAWHYQRIAMDYNKLAGYTLGIAITHVNYGMLYERQGDLDSAMREYQASMDITRDMTNRWQWLMSSTKWIGLSIKNGNYDIVRADLDLAEQYAEDIHSLTHIADVARLNYLYYEGKGDVNRSFNYFKTYKLYSDSLRSTQSTDVTHNLRLLYERENSNREFSAMQKEHEVKQRIINMWLMVGAVVLLFAVTAIFFLVFALRMRTRSQQAMKQIDEMRSSFFTNITHEFRTPLTVIMGMAGQLKKKKNGNDTEAKVIMRQSETLLDMANQLLDMAKVKSSVDHLKWCHDDVAAYVGMTAETYRAYLSTKDIDLIFKSDKRSIFMDFVPEYFEKILRNLLSNAQKHTPKDGNITLSISAGSTCLTLTVSDTGKGIPPADLPHIFEEFYQGDRSHAETGTGIGLAFVSKMIENMSGRITARNLPEGGAEFSITMPLKQKFEVNGEGSEIIAAIKDDAKVYTQNTSAVLDGSTEGIAIADHIAKDDTTPIFAEDEKAVETAEPSILVIEDNADVRFYIGSLLGERYHIRYASNGEEGIAKAEVLMPDLIVTDLMMPIMDGYAVCHAIRENEILNHIPIIVITAKATNEDKQKALEAGADAYLYKPFNADELYIRVNKLLEQRSLLRDKYSKAMSKGVQEKVELSVANRQCIDRLSSVVYERIADTELNIDTVANEMHMSRSQLNRKIRSITGNSTSSFILNVRIEKAKRLLLTDETPIADIAIKCGFDDSNYFTRVFKQIYGVSPSQYRKTIDCSPAASQ